MSNPNRMKSTINGYLFTNKSWKLVYWDDNSFLFVKDIPKFADVINKYQFTVLNPYNMYFNKSVFESDIKNNPYITNSELDRKTRTEPDGFLYKNMSALVSKYFQGK